MCLRVFTCQIKIIKTHIHVRSILNTTITFTKMTEENTQHCLICIRHNEEQKELNPLFQTFLEIDHNHYVDLFNKISEVALQLDYNSIHLILNYIPKLEVFPEEQFFDQHYTQNFPILLPNGFIKPTCSHLQHIDTDRFKFIQIKKKDSKRELLVMFLAEKQQQNSCFYVAHIFYITFSDNGTPTTVETETYIDTNFEYLLQFCTENSKSIIKQKFIQTFIKGVFNYQLDKCALLHLSKSKPYKRSQQEIHNKEDKIEIENNKRQKT